MDEGPARVRAWRDRLRAIDPTAWSGPLSVSGARAAWEAALDALTDSGLADAIGRPGEPFPAAAVVVARTVSTAPIEWCAVLLGRGTRVVLKHPTGEPGIAPALVEAADAVGLPLTATDDRAALADLPLVVAMGADPSIAAIRAAHP
ncbi:MAG: hypothetical protein ABMB14_39670, partial [Myxococcota bacterium]